MDTTTVPLVSVVVPCYNYGNFLEETLNCILNQSYTNWECIIVDDGSSDNTAEVAREFQKRDTRFIYHYQDNAGLPAARNTGILQTRGKYLQFLDADDLVHTDKIRLQVQYLETHPEAGIVYGDSAGFYTDRPNVYIQQTPWLLSLKTSGKGIVMVRSLVFDNYFMVSGPLVKKEVITRTGLFNTAYNSYEDWEYWFRCAVAGIYFSYVPIKGTETYIRYGHSSMMTNIKKLTVNGIKLRKYMAPFLPFSLKIYNIYRLVKLYLRLLFTWY